MLSDSGEVFVGWLHICQWNNCERDTCCIRSIFHVIQWHRRMWHHLLNRMELAYFTMATRLLLKCSYWRGPGRQNQMTHTKWYMKNKWRASFFALLQNRQQGFIGRLCAATFSLTKSPSYTRCPRKTLRCSCIWLF